jgi:predicted Zn-dependent protease
VTPDECDAVETVDALDFVIRVKPALEAQDWDRLARTLRNHWTSDQLMGLLYSPNADARKLAALSIGLIGQPSVLPELSGRLRDTDRMVVEMVEHAMWQIWFRGGSDAANTHLARGAEALNRQDTEAALGHLNKAIALSPDFPEAYNQRATAYYLLDRYDDAVRDCRHVVSLMPLHFGAWSGLGHALLALGDVRRALDAYQRALSLNPHLDCITELVQELREQIGATPPSV